MKRRFLHLLISLVMVITAVVPASFAFGTIDTSEVAMLDGSKVTGKTQEELDEESVMGSSMFEGEISIIDRSGLQLMCSYGWPSKAWTKTAKGEFYNGKGTAIITGAISKGLDISEHQGKLDFKKIKDNGIDYIIIRLGFGSDGYKDQDDIRLTEYVQGCEEYNIPYGFYLYSYANTKAKNESEIDHVLRLVKGTNPTYPIYYDLEDRGTTGGCSNATIQSYALNFCKKIEDAGYTPGIYASLSWWNGKLNSTSLDSYEKWVARYDASGNYAATNSNYSKSHSMWQSTSKYHISGINKTNGDPRDFDLDFAYKTFGKLDNPTATKATTTQPTTTQPATTTSSTTTKSSGTVTNGWVTKDGGKYYYKSGKLQKSTWLTVSDKKYYATSTGAIYRSAYKKIGSYHYGFDSSGVMYASKTAKIDGKSYYFASNGHARLCTVKTKTKINYRTGAGTSYKSKGLYSKNKELTIYRKSGDWWQTASGYWVHSKYLKVTKKYPY